MIPAKRCARNTGREAGSILIVVLLLLTLFTMVSAGQFFISHKNIAQGNYINSRDRLRRYAESAARIALHDLRYEVTGYLGNIGTSAWTSASDLGKDGVAATGDEGEGDGLPTYGEPNIAAVTIGSATDNSFAFVYTVDSGYTDIKRIVATAYSGEVSSTVETYARYLVGSASIPRAGAVYVDPGVVLDLRGNGFSISGFDTNPDGTDGPGPDTYGLGTAQGATAGENASTLVSQIAPSRYDQVTGLGSDPSVGESTTTVSIEQMYNSFRPYAQNTPSPGTHTNVTWGTSASPQITYVDGDLHLSGSGTGYGALVVDGNLTMSGQFDFVGLVIVRGDVRQTGGGAGVHIYGSLMVAGVFSLIEDPDLLFTGNADITYSSVALDVAASTLATVNGTYEVLYWNLVD